MRTLLDTHAFLWWISDSRRLSETARRAIENDADTIFVSAASAWEIATKQRIGKLAHAGTGALDVTGTIAGQGFEELAISVDDAERAGRLPGPHRDPFDRMLVAQALARDMTIVSVDRMFDGYGVHRLW